ncbi:MAG TPA: ABC transporter ATP-binding protein [Verrucomicrobiae bacterium]|nr:ABC transporter ATP-binding protein [Verrucomicrobiae bacterium]
MTTPAIEFRQVTKVYRKRLRGVEIPALTNATFSVLPGEVCAFLGPNGAGKTTSINLLMGFFYADFGEIRVLGYEPGDVRAKAHIGFLPENFAFYKYLTAKRLLRFHHALSGGRKEEAATLIPELLARVKLTGYEELKIGKYSRGMVQRLGVAQALLHDPQLLVLDEPTSGLDPTGRKDVRDLMSALRDAGKTVFLSSHLLSEVEQVCDRVIIISKGRVIQSGRMDDLLGVADRVEIRVTSLPEELEQRVVATGGTIARNEHGITLVVGVAQKREVAEAVWASGHDVVHILPLRSSLEDLYMKTVGTEGGVA